MKQIIKVYAIGLLAILALVQPYYVGKYIIGLNFDYPGSAYVWSCALEVMAVFVLVSPYIIGTLVKAFVSQSGKDK